MLFLSFFRGLNFKRDGEQIELWFEALIKNREISKLDGNIYSLVDVQRTKKVPNRSILSKAN